MDRTRRSPVEPAFQLGQGDQNAAAATDDAKLAQHVFVEVVAADAEDAGGFVGAEREPRAEPGRRGSNLMAAGWLLGPLDWQNPELKLLRGHLPRHRINV